MDIFVDIRAEHEEKQQFDIALLLQDIGKQCFSPFDRSSAWDERTQRIQQQTKDRRTSNKSKTQEKGKTRAPVAIAKEQAPKAKTCHKQSAARSKSTSSSVRTNLQSLEEVRGTFIGEFKRFGGKGGKRVKKLTVLLVNISDGDGNAMCDHIWLNAGKQIKELGHLSVGDKIKFNGRIKKYRKGSIRRGIPVRFDYKFSHPSKVQRI